MLLQIFNIVCLKYKNKIKTLVLKVRVFIYQIEVIFYYLVNSKYLMHAIDIPIVNVAIFFICTF